nr:hypothetical protein [Endozoicomonas sp.]
MATKKEVGYLQKYKQNERFIENQMLIWLGVGIFISTVGTVVLESFRMEIGGVIFFTEQIHLYSRLDYTILNWINTGLSVSLEFIVNDAYMVIMPSISILFYRNMKIQYCEELGIKSPEMGVLAWSARICIYGLLAYVVLFNVLKILLVIVSKFH